MNNILKKNLQIPPLYNSFQETLRQLLWKTPLGRDSSVQILLVNSHTSFGKQVNLLVNEESQMQNQEQGIG